MWKFDICEDWNIIWGEKYQEQWSRLLEESPMAHVFFHPSLVKAWVKTYLPLRKLTPIFVFGEDQDSDNKVFMPLVLWRKNWKNAFLRVIIPVGYSDYDYHNPIFRIVPRDMGPFWGALLNELKSFAVDAIIIDGIKESCIDTVNPWKQGEACPYLDLSNIKKESDLMSFLKTSLRGDIRRQIRRLTELGDLNFREYVSFEELNETFPIFISEHSLRWPKAYKAPGFHKNLLIEGLGGVTHFSTLNIDDKPIAWHLGFEYAGIYYYYMPAGDHEYSKYSPTKIHLYYLIKRAVINGLYKYDHLRGEETYKQGWSNGVDLVNSLKLSSNGIGSKIKRMCLNIKYLCCGIGGGNSCCIDKTFLLGVVCLFLFICESRTKYSHE